MEPFYSLAFAFGLNSLLEEDMFDIVGKLPEEISVMILRMLDSRTLLSAAVVSKKWLNLCHADLTLRTRIRQQIHKERKEIFNPCVIVRTHQNNSQPLAAFSGVHRITVSAVSNIRPRPEKIQLPVTQRFKIPAGGQSQALPMKRKFSKKPKVKSIRV